jgi:putative selenate reductase
MRPIPFAELVGWVRGEYTNHGSVFGIRAEKFYRPAGEHGNTVLFGARISSPIGPAAGPNAQLAQNILAAYLAGARFMELKTVQVMDGEELRKAVARPCINAMDEGYNVEWSTELTVAEAQEEYIKAWFLCHLFRKECNIPDTGGVIFNISVGYSLEGIKSEKIDSYIEGMKNAENTAIWKSCFRYLANNISSFDRFTQKDLDAVSPAVSNSVTLSTLHGCPREEIEKIAAYLITEKGMHTFVKCNPTLLGYETARRLLDELGYGYISFDEHHFKNDLQFNDAVDMFTRLAALAQGRKLSFGVKLTNTFPVEIKRNELPGTEMYMSGRALFPLSINVAQKLSGAFKGELPISYSGGADFFNLERILASGIRPVTMATTILKPGGYERFTQLAELAEKVPERAASAGGIRGRINVDALKELAESVSGQERFRREYRRTGSRKTKSALSLFDCEKAPCMEGGCPIHQRIPDYLAAVAAENYGEAFKIIALDNTAPSITGTICDHQCQHKCTRLDYDDPLRIRQAKLISADKAQEDFIASLRPAELKTGKSAAVIGAGPAGIAAAVFLRRNGVPVTVYEKREKPFGIVRYVIPSFRISDEVIHRDFRIAEKTGVEFRFNARETYSIAALRKNHDYIVIAAGAWKEGPAVVKQQGEEILDALRFLEESKESHCGLSLGKRVAVIGGGDVAMDCARAAKRNRGVESVTIVYRRTREFMPSQYEEQELTLAEGVVIKELLAPETWSGGVLTCAVMRLGEYESSGRRSIESTGTKEELRFDTVIAAAGAAVDTEFFTHNGIALNAGGFPRTGASGESSVPGVYIAGDCRAGPATVVKAIADGKAAAADILRKLGLEADFSAGPENAARSGTSAADLYRKKGLIIAAKRDHTDGYRCLSCDTLCEICVDVCPNRANVAVRLPAVGGAFRKTHQIVHIDRSCNECGNCATFCPHAGKPYRDKFTVFSGGEDFADSGNAGFLKTGADTYTLRLEDKSVLTYRRGGEGIPDGWAAMIKTIEEQYGYLVPAR